MTYSTFPSQDSSISAPAQYHTAMHIKIMSSYNMQVKHLTFKTVQRQFLPTIGHWVSEWSHFIIWRQRAILDPDHPGHYDPDHPNYPHNPDHRNPDHDIEQVQSKHLKGRS